MAKVIKMYGSNPKKYKKLESKLLKKVEKFNRKAEKWFIAPVVIGADLYPTPFGVLPEFDEKVKNFWQLLVASYKYGYLHEDWITIMKLCRELRNLRNH